ncbi:MAG TPA: adenylate/guanylate cyclase domain-containing protein [Oligoflexus sp.]|uniref:adenylate/guanylate cyclase domain-containing protein n=1 Tax=Oligoflexus sp. TaxID=1971216 RepID=UPI002D69B6A1|nr:adenylate/guanylate cyclase domain-containing protein [Oligoflexus sp.]HYX31638.1 adenylate/guanylate cyclase domain-containing protein [Oligoflexus sp.]
MRLLVLIGLWLGSGSLWAGPCLKSNASLSQLLNQAADDPVTLLEQSRHDLASLRDRTKPLMAPCMVAIGLAEMSLHDISAIKNPSDLLHGARLARQQGWLDGAAVLEAMSLAHRLLQGEHRDVTPLKEFLRSTEQRSLDAQIISQILLYDFLEYRERAYYDLKLKQIADDETAPLLYRATIYESFAHRTDYRKFADRSVTAFQDLWQLIQPMPLRYFKANTSYNLGVMHTWLKTREGDRAASQALQKALDLLRNLPASGLHGSVLIAQANLLNRANQTQAALLLLQNALTYFQPELDEEWLGDAQIKAAMIYAKSGQWQKTLAAVETFRRLMPASLIYDHIIARELEAQAYYGLRNYPRAYDALHDHAIRLRAWHEGFAQETYQAEAARLGLQAEKEKTRALTVQQETASENLRLEAIKTQSLRLQLGQRFGLAALLLVLTGVSLWISIKVIRNMMELRRMNHYLATQVLQRFMPPQVIREVLQGRMHWHEQPEQRLVTALFIDIVSFTEATENLGTTEISRILNRFMVATTQETFAQNGLIERYVGDAVMIIFGDTGNTQASVQAQQALACAEAILARLQNINLDLPPDLNWHLRVRIGIHQGLAVVGSIGHAARMEYMALGEAVNVAHKLQEEAEPGEILISRPMTYHLSADRYTPRASHRSVPASIDLFVLKKSA